MFAAGAPPDHGNVPMHVARKRDNTSDDGNVDYSNETAKSLRITRNLSAFPLAKM